MNDVEVSLTFPAVDLPKGFWQTKSSLSLKKVSIIHLAYFERSTQASILKRFCFLPLFFFPFCFLPIFFLPFPFLPIFFLPFSFLPIFFLPFNFLPYFWAFVCLLTYLSLRSLLFTALFGLVCFLRFFFLPFVFVGLFFLPLSLLFLLLLLRSFTFFFPLFRFEFSFCLLFFFDALSFLEETSLARLFLRGLFFFSGGPHPGVPCKNEKTIA